MFIGSVVENVLFCNDKLLVKCPKGLFLVDMVQYKIQPVIDPSCAFFSDKPTKSSPKNIFLVSDNSFLLCFEGI